MTQLNGDVGERIVRIDERTQSILRRLDNTVTEQEFAPVRRSVELMEARVRLAEDGVRGLQVQNRLIAAAFGLLIPIVAIAVSVIGNIVLE